MVNGCARTLPESTRIQFSRPAVPCRSGEFQSGIIFGGTNLPSRIMFLNIIIALSSRTHIRQFVSPVNFRVFRLPAIPKEIDFSPKKAQKEFSFCARFHIDPEPVCYHPPPQPRAGVIQSSRYRTLGTSPSSSINAFNSSSVSLRPLPA